MAHARTQAMQMQFVCFFWSECRGFNWEYRMHQRVPSERTSQANGSIAICRCRFITKNYQFVHGTWAFYMFNSINDEIPMQMWNETRRFTCSRSHQTKPKKNEAIFSVLFSICFQLSSTPFRNAFDIRNFQNYQHFPFRVCVCSTDSVVVCRCFTPKVSIHIFGSGLLFSEILSRSRNDKQQWQS